MDALWTGLGVGCLFALMIHGWPNFFTINIHKHYGKKGE